MNNILIIGGAGYIGRQIIHLLNKKKYKIFVIDNLSTTKKNYLKKNIYFSKISILDKKKLNNFFKKNNFESVIHLAAKCVVSESEIQKKLYYRTNVIGTNNILENCKKFNIKNFLFSSTCSVYAESNKVLNENSLKKPKSYYGKTKLIAEKLIEKKLIKTKTKFIILRYFNVVGADFKNHIGEIGNKDRLFNNISKRILKKNYQINIYGNDYKTKDGTCIRDYMHVYDLANIHIKCLEKIKKIKKKKFLNCSYGKEYSVIDIVKSFNKFTKQKIKINFKQKRIGDMEKAISSNKKFNKFIKWKPRYNNINTMVKSTLLWNKFIL